MPSQKIVAVPDARLRAASEEVTFGPKIVALAKQMKAATLRWERNRPHELGVALAAPQIGANKRVIIVRENLEEKEDHNFVVLINPKITKTFGEPVARTEGCLSVPDIYGDVPRYPKVTVSGLSVEGKVVRIKAEGFLARVLQHEIDHLEGMLFIDKVVNEHYYELDHDGELKALDAKAKAKYSFLR